MLNTTLLKDPSPAELGQYSEAIGHSSRNNTATGTDRVSAPGVGKPTRLSDLLWNTAVKKSDGTIITPKEFKALNKLGGIKYISCHSPFRDDNNPSAFMKLDKKGNPFLYDSGAHETHFLAEAEMALEGELLIGKTPVVAAIEAVINSRYEIYSEQEAIEFMNQRYAIVMTGNKCCVIEPNFDDPALGCRSVRFSTLNQLSTFLKHKKVKISDKFSGLVDYWSAHKNAIRYNAIDFNPTQKPSPPNVFNLFRGLSRQPKKGKWWRFWWHIYAVICNKDKELFDYVLAWMANIVQGRPKPGVALVLQGEKGSGKGTFVNILGLLFGPHFIQLVQKNQLVVNFNAHMREAYLVFADEAFFAGDKQAEGALKAIITEPLLMLEQKGIDAVQIRNFINIIFATNNAWAVPASEDERRFVVMVLNNIKKQKHFYFEAIHKQMLEQGGLEAMLYDLLNFDLSKINLRKIPKTKALTSQITSTNIELQFLFERIDSGSLCDVWDTETRSWMPMPWGDGKVTKQDLYECYVRFYKNSGFGRPLVKETFGKVFKPFVDGLRESKITRTLPGQSVSSKIPCWIFPSIDECKLSIDAKLPTPLDWSKDEIDPADVFEAPAPTDADFNPFYDPNEQPEDFSEMYQMMRDQGLPTPN